MNDDIQSLISGLPQWLQILVIVAVVVIGAFFGKKGVSRDKASTGQVKKRAEASSTLEFETSPGQSGAGATVDLELAQIRKLQPAYDPKPHDADPDPGEVVWTWVPFVENDGRGKDRPVLIIARIDANSVAGCYLSTKQHRDFISVGTGPWDSERRESFLSPERVLRISHDGMRREGATMPRDNFDKAIKQLKRYQPIL